MAESVIEEGFFGVDLYVGVQHKTADIVNAVVESILHVHLLQDLPAGAAAHHVDVKYQISQQLTESG